MSRLEISILGGSITSESAASKYLPGVFSRASTATYIDASGVLQTAGVNIPRYQGGALLVEAAATNLLLFSASLGNAVWKFGGGATLGVNAGVAPDGTITAALFTPGVIGNAPDPTATGANRILQECGTVYGLYSDSIWVKAQTTIGAAAIFVVDKNTDIVMARYDFTANNQWQRVSVSGTTSPSGPSTAGVRFLFACSYACYIFGAQSELGNLSSHIPTTNAPVTRAADILS